jgi:hypothetical protein
MFHAQSERWEDISRRYVDAVVSLVSRFIHSALAFIVKDPEARQSLTEGIKVNLNISAKEAFEELDKLLQDEIRHPITYNHYYTDNI